MSNAVITTIETMSSVDIADITGKNHKEVMRAIRTMEPAWEKVCGRKFALTSREVEMPNGGTKDTPCYDLTKSEVLYVATKFNDEARAKLVKRWEVLEAEHMASMPAVPTSFSQALLLAAQQQEQIEKQQLQIATQNKELLALATSVTSMEKKVSYLDKVFACPSTVKVKVIAQDYGMSAIAFNQMLHNYGIQYKCGSEWILYAKYINEGYVQSVSFSYEKTNGSIGLAYNTQWTQKGRFFLYDFLKGKGILPLIEQTND